MKELEISPFLIDGIERILASGDASAMKIENIRLLSNLSGYAEYSLAEILISFFTYN
jgi:hypothetical protein